MGSAKKAVGILPVLTTFIPGAQAFAPALSMIARYGVMKYESRAQKKQENLRYGNEQQQLAMSERIRAADARFAESERLQTLRRAVARQRARFGAQGVGNDGGSSEAVLLGLFEESEQEKFKREQLDNLRNQAGRLDVEGRHSLNLLELTSQAERRNLELLYSN
ncbi:MAG TPA: hypothetical protein PKX38_01585 [Alphaproteobacteria bacterium]|nr:hypothetical protein [Micavibrio sp.]MBK9561742.1 hypothetical protein [Micavibrio sp.]HQX26610.1 hypothetical protein [Alphaproteobacteria bacterium]